MLLGMMSPPFPETFFATLVSQLLFYLILEHNMMRRSGNHQALQRYWFEKQAFSSAPSPPILG
jgi:hypothetical protein